MAELTPRWALWVRQERKLSLIVQTDNQDIVNQTKNTKELSGGERSYATLALLLALGGAIESPFRGAPHSHTVTSPTFD